MSVAAVCLGLLAYFVPDHVGRLALGPTWDLAQPILPIAAVEYAFLAWMSAGAGGVRAQGRSQSLLTIRVVFATTSAAFGIVAAALTQSATYVALGLMASAILGALLAWWVLAAVEDRSETGTERSPRSVDQT
jgi:Na+-driven multidrug efflux pump